MEEAAFGHYSCCLGIGLLLFSTGCFAPVDESGLIGSIRIDGSSTVLPISIAVAEEFRPIAPRVRTSVSARGTSGGMSAFIMGEIEICDASRPIKDSEREKCAEADIDFIELTIAFDGLAIVANPKNDWCNSLTVEQLRQLWQPEAEDTVMKWSDVDPDWPDEEFKLYGPGTSSGTFEYFTETICGEAGASRTDFQRNEDDNMLVRGVAGEDYSLCYFGFAYYAQNKSILKLIGVDSGSGPIQPSEDTVRDGSYKPLSRPLFIYVRKDALERPEVEAFVRFYLENAAALASFEQYVPVSEEVEERNWEVFEAALSTRASLRDENNSPEIENDPN